MNFVKDPSAIVLQVQNRIRAKGDICLYGCGFLITTHGPEIDIDGNPISETNSCSLFGRNLCPKDRNGKTEVYSKRCDECVDSIE